MGICDNDYVLYRARFSVRDAAAAKDQSLHLKLFSPDGLSVALNGQMLRQAGDAPKNVQLPVGDTLKAGDNGLLLLFENQARPNGGGGMEDRKGLQDARLVAKAVDGIPLKTWRIKQVPDIKDRPEVAPDFDDSQWEPVTLQTESWQSQMAGNGTVCVFRIAVDLTEDQLKAGLTQLQLDGIDDDAWAYANGRLLGEGHDWREAFTFDAKESLHAGRNVFAAVVRNNDGPGGLHREARLARSDQAGSALSWELSPLGGVAARWFDPRLDDSKWSRVALDTSRQLPAKRDASAPAPAPQSGALMTWYRLRFELPQTPGVWVPWRIRLDASGNGMLYLNGEPLGRYWDVGPQREFYLPECWLNLGEGKPNVLTLSLRSTGQGTDLRAAEVLPYAEFAEKR
jgi:hypothetical protein